MYHTQLNIQASSVKFTHMNELKMIQSKLFFENIYIILSLKPILDS